MTTAEKEQTNERIKHVKLRRKLVSMVESVVFWSVLMFIYLDLIQTPRIMSVGVYCSHYFRPLVGWLLALIVVVAAADIFFILFSV